MAVVQVLVSEDGRWRVDVFDTGRAEIRQDGYLRGRARDRRELRVRLTNLGLDLDQLREG